LAFNAPTHSVEMNEWETAKVHTLFSDNHLTPALHWLSDGRLIYAINTERTGGRADSSVWAVTLSPDGKISGSPKHLKRFFEVVAVRRWSASGRDAHVNQAESSGSVLAAQKYRVGVSHQADVRQVGIVRLAHAEIAFGIVGRNGSSGLTRSVWAIAHCFSPAMKVCEAPRAPFLKSDIKSK
jgi:hypothetical protein